jgi:hypothetical protein
MKLSPSSRRAFTWAAGICLALGWSPLIFFLAVLGFGGERGYTWIETDLGSPAWITPAMWIVAAVGLILAALMLRYRIRLALAIVLGISSLLQFALLASG